MNFQVPQFIEIEDQVFGPLTWKQFLYIVGGAGICFLIYIILGWVLGIIPMVAVAGFSLALAFYKINNRPFIIAVESAIKYFFTRKLYIWKKEEIKKTIPTASNSIQPINKIPKMSASKLKDLTWSLDVTTNIK